MIYPSFLLLILFLFQVQLVALPFFTVVLTLISQKTVFSSLSHCQIYHCLEIFTGHTSVSD